MCVIITRSAVNYWSGKDLPPDVSHLIDDKPVTYAELRDKKRAWQREHLALIRGSDNPVRQAAQVWVFLVPGLIYGGWHLYIRTIKHRWWLRHEHDIFERKVIEMVMKAFPCGLPPLVEKFYEWKIAFANQYRCRAGKRKQGMVNCWIECRHDGALPHDIKIT